MDDNILKSRLLERLTGTQTPRFVTKKEYVIIDKFVEVMKEANSENDALQKRNKTLEDALKANHEKLLWCYDIISHNTPKKEWLTELRTAMYNTLQAIENNK